MTLEDGRRLGPYEIVGPLGAGAMGEVYEARDTRLGRRVALKVLPEEPAANPERRARFEREARTVSQLSHPHVCTLHDVREEDGIHYLVLELCEGETLARRLERGAVPLEDGLRYGTQIAEALDAAHRRGIVHRDLKPANVMLTRSGVKVLDFGLAGSAAVSGGSATDLPTLTGGPGHSPTREGAVLGTFPYMAPEQVEGGQADARSDVFALGAVLYEMATGRRAFAGESAASVIAGVLREEPEPLSRSLPVVPPALDHVVARCLAKDPEERWQSARDVAGELRWIAGGGGRAGSDRAAATPRGRRELVPWAIAGVLAMLLLAGAGWALSRRSAESARTLLRVSLPAPEATSYASIPALSADGGRLAFVAAADSGPARLWVRRLDSLVARPLDGTEHASLPFWSPGGESLGFFADGELRRVDLASGTIRTLARADIPGGGAWSSRGVILFVDRGRGLLRIPASGGPAVSMPLLGEAPGRVYFWPHVLPGGDRFSFSAWTEQGEAGLFLGSLDGATAKLLRRAPRGAVVGRAEYDPAGFLLFTSSEGPGTPLLAQRLDLDREELMGDPVQVADEVFVTGPGEARFSVGPGGLLVFRASASRALRRLTWLSGEGEVVGALANTAAWNELDLSPDGTTVAVAGSGEGLWLLDLRSGTSTRAADGYSPTWSPDGRRVAFSAGGPANPFVLDVAAGGEPRRVTTFPTVANPTGWTPDGRHLVVETLGGGGGLFLVPVDGGEIERLIGEDGDVGGGRVSPDGRWLAFVSDETGDPEVYVTSFPRPGLRWRVSTAGGSDPRWAPAGGALFYRSREAVVRVPIAAEREGLRIGEHGVALEREDLRAWDPGPDGRFLAALDAGERLRPPLTVISDWRLAAGLASPR